MQELLVGDPAPGIRMAEFVKGAPLSATVIIAILASAGVGIIFGYLTAHRAAALNPIDALRRE
jgi:ABC-type antimicrobial peptide transport system permease subunit